MGDERLEMCRGVVTALGRYSMFFFSNATLHDGPTQKVIEIIEFLKEFLKADGDAFYDV